VEERLYGPKGFTAKPEIINILSRYETGLSYGGIAYFDCLPTREARQLLELLPPEQGEDRQNLAPSFAKLVELGEKFQEVYFHGYRVFPERSDERITLEGFYAHREVAEAMLSECEWPPDEYEEIEHPRLGRIMRAWWD